MLGLLSLLASSVWVSPATARPIEIPEKTEALSGGTYKGSHFFEFPVNFGSILKVYVPENADDVYMILYDPDGLEIRRGNNLAGPGTKTLEYKFTWGDVWYLHVQAPASLEYSLQVSWTGGGDKEPEDQHPPIRLVDENVTVFELESEGVFFSLMPPTVKFEIENIDWDELGLDPGRFMRPGSLILKYDLEISGESNSYEKWSKTVQGCGSWLLEDPTRYEIKGGTLHYREPLYDILIRSGDNPYTLLAYNHFNSTNSKSVPEEMKLEIKMTPLELRSMVGVPPKAHSIYMSSFPATTATFIFGSKIDLALDTKLKFGEGDPTNWHDYPDVGLCLLKLATGWEGLIDIIDAYIQFYAGEYVDAIVTLVAPAPVELLFAIPEAQRMGQEFLAPTSVIEEVWDGLRKLGYVSLSKLKATKDFPIWINLEAEKFAMVDPTGIVHRVEPSSNFHVSWAYFTLWEAIPFTGGVSYRSPDTSGKFVPWNWTQVGQPETLSHRPLGVIPPPKKYQPARVMLATGLLGALGAQIPPADELHIRTKDIWTGHAGQLILSDSGEPPVSINRCGAIDLGWEDDPMGLILKRPYACLISGKLHVKDVDSKIGVGFYEINDGKRTNYIPRVWCEPKGTEYIIEIISEERFRVTAIEGSIEVTSANGDLIGTVNAGESQEFGFPEVPLREEVPVAFTKGLTFESRSKTRWSTVQIPLILSGIQETVGNMDLTLYYDPEILEATEVIKGSLTTDTLFDYNINGGTARISLADNEGFSGDGSVAYVRFNVIGIEGSISPLDIESVLTNRAADYGQVNIPTSNGVFRVIAFNESVADCDGDGKISVVDALCALQMAVNKIPEDLVMDVNSDGMVSSLDAKQILQMAVGN